MPSLKHRAQHVTLWVVVVGLLSCAGALKQVTPQNDTFDDMMTTLERDIAEDVRKPPNLANLRLRAPGGDLETQWKECANLKHRAVVFNLATRPDRWEGARTELLKRGVCPARVVACMPTNTEQLNVRGRCASNYGGPCLLNETLKGVGVLQKCKGSDVVSKFDWKRENQYLYNGLTQIGAWRAVQPLVEDSEYMLFFEDDIAVHSSVGDQVGEEFSDMLAKMLSRSKTSRHLIAYFGMCAPMCQEAEDEPDTQDLGITSVKYNVCQGRCAHAYALSGRALKDLRMVQERLLEHVYTGKPKTPFECPKIVGCIQDPYGGEHLLRQGCDRDKLPPFLSKVHDGDYCGNLYGKNLMAPDDKHDKFGIFYQNREVYGTDIGM